MTIEDVCNQALNAIGYPRRIGNIYDGTKAARIALDHWGQLRDLIFQQTHPEWARRDTVLVLLKSAPNIVNGTANYSTGWTLAYPPVNWLYEYQRPVDCIQPLQVKSAPLFLPDWRPRPVTQRLAYDQDSILSNEPNAILTYVAQVLDPNLWNNDFVGLMVEGLAKIMSAELAPQRPQQKEPQDGRANTSG